MKITKKNLVKAYQASIANPDMPAWFALAFLLVNSLSDQEQIVFDNILVAPGITATAIAKKVGLEPNHVGNIANMLADYGLVRKEDEITKYGKQCKLFVVHFDIGDDTFVVWRKKEK